MDLDLSPSQAKGAIIDLIQVGLVPFVTSSPGLGKSSICAQIAEEFDLILIDLRLSQCTPEDLMGLPMRDGDRARFVPFNMFPTEGTKIPAGKNGWLLFLDEFNSCSKSVQAAAYKIVLDKMVGQEHLHENVFIVAAGNKDSDKAIVNRMSTAMQSRVVHLGMRPDHREAMAYGHKKGWDYRVLAYLDFQPAKLHEFQPDHDDKTFPCPRTWEFLSRYVDGKTVDEISLPVSAGIVGSGAAVSFRTFLKEFAKLPSFLDIVNKPTTTEVPAEGSTCYALLGLINEKTTVKNFPDVVEYVVRMPAEFQVLFFRAMRQRHPSLRRTKEWIRHIANITRYLDDDDAELAA